MTRWAWLVLVAALVAAALLLANPTPESLQPLISVRFPDVEWVDTETFAAWMKRESPVEPVILDVRSEDEFAVSHLPGAVRVDPEASELESLGIPADATVVVYCSVGYRSGAIAQQLNAVGIDDVYNLRGGIFAWANEGRPLVRDGAPAGAVHPYDAIWGLFLRSDLHDSRPRR
jgi:rhodanese-related sulfurtransferase